MKYPRGHVALERALSKLGLASRSEGRRLIRAGGVSVNGRTETEPLAAVHPERDRIEPVPAVAICSRHADLRDRVRAGYHPAGCVLHTGEACDESGSDGGAPIRMMGT